MIQTVEQEVIQIENELSPLFDLLVEKDYSNSVHEYEEKCKFLFSRNLTFLRCYLGFIEKFGAYNQVEFSDLLSVSVTSLRRWESAAILPGKAFLKAILAKANSVLNFESPIRIADVLCKNVVDLITKREAQALIPEKQAPINPNIFKIPHEISGFIDDLRNFVYDVENRIYSLIESMPCATCIFLKNRIIFVNKFFSEMTGYSFDELLIEESPIEMIFESSTISLVRNEISAINNDEKLSVYLPAKIVLKNFSIIKIELRLSAALFEGQNIILGNFLDVDYSKYINYNEQIASVLKIFSHAVSDFVLVFDTHKNIKFATPNFNHILGYSEENLSDSLFLQTLFEDKYNDFSAKFYDKLNKNSSEDVIFEVKIKNRKREDLYFDAILTNQISDSYFQGVVLHLRDASKRKELENDYFSLNANTLNLLNSLPLSYFVIDRNGVLIDYKGDQKVFNYRNRDIVGFKIDKIFESPLAEQIVSSIEKTIKDKLISTLEFQLYFNGEKVWYNAKIEPFTGAKAILIASEITERKELELRLQSERDSTEINKKLFQEIIDASSDLIAIKDRSFRFQATNRAFANAFRMNVKDLIGKDDYDLGLSHDYITGSKERGIAGLRKFEKIALSGKVAKCDCEQILLPTGELKTYVSERTPIFDAEGDVIAIICYFREISGFAKANS